MAEEEEEPEEAGAEASNKKKIIIIVVVVLLVLLIIVAVILTVLFLTVLKNEDSDQQNNTLSGRSLDGNDTGLNETDPELPILELDIMSKQQVPFTESYNYCKSKGMAIIVTDSQRKENSLVKYLRTNHYKYEECRKYFIGFHSVRERKFMSTDGNKYYPSLDTSYDAIKPNPGRMCAEVSLNSNLAVREVPCSEVESLCFVCEYKEEGAKCPQDHYLTSCYQDLILQTPKGAWVGYGFCELLNKPLWGLMPIDRKVPELRREYFRHIDNPKCKDVVHGVAVRFPHKYQTMERKPMKYNSSRFTAIEPLYDCLALDSTRDFSLVTESCLAPNCAICAPLV